MDTQITNLLYRLAKYYGKELNDVQIGIYSDFLGKFSQSECLKIVTEVMNKCKFFPTIAEINEIIKPQDDTRDLAYEMAGMIIDAISKFGYCNELEAKAHLGPEAWFAVEQFGGWRVICWTTEENIPTVRAQLRDACKAVFAIKRRDPTRLHVLPMEFQKRNVKRLADIVKSFNHLKEITHEPI